MAYLIDAGWDVFVIQHHVGHASIKTTLDVYGHRLTRGDKARLKALEQRLPSQNVAALNPGRKQKKGKKGKTVVSPFIDGIADAA